MTSTLETLDHDPFVQMGPFSQQALAAPPNLAPLEMYLYRIDSTQYWTGSDHTISILPGQSQPVTFHWQTGQKGAVGAIWQVARFPFAPGQQQWLEPAGLLASGPAGNVPAAGTWTGFTIDLGQVISPLLPKGSQAGTQGPQAQPSKMGWFKRLLRWRAPTTVVPADAKPNLAGAKNSTQRQSKPSWNETLRGEDQNPTSDRGVIAPGSDTREIGSQSGLTLQSAFAAISPAALNALGYTGVVYVRVVPVADAAGKKALYPGRAMTITYQPPTTPNVHLPSPPVGDTRVYPQVHITAYRTSRDPESPMQHFVVTHDYPPAFPIWHAGDHVTQSDLTPHESVLDKITDALSDFFGYISSALSWVANAYQSIQADVASALASAVNGLSIPGVHVDPSVIKGAMDIGMVALGIPPTLPNLDQLIDGQIDSLALQFADAAGIPDTAMDAAMPLIDDQVNQLAAQIKSAANGGGDPSHWLRSDPDYLGAPACVEIQATAGDQPTTFVWITVSSACVGSTGTPSTGNLYRFTRVAVPKLQPHEQKTVVAYLTPDVADWWRVDLSQLYGSGVKSDTDPQAGDSWSTAYMTGTLHIEVKSGSFSDILSTPPQQDVTGR